MAEAAKRAAMTERLYYDDSFLREFDARVISCEADGARWRVRVERTAFYPTSGGQPFDTGRLGEAHVVEVMDDEAAGADDVIHFTEQPLALGAVHGTIDWPRRFDHMQQHTAQHMLSAAFIELFQFQTVSFHLGREMSSIDLAAPSVVPRHLEEAERRVNEIVFENRAVTVRYGTQETLAGEGIRKKVEREGILRVIDIENFDRQPCGGTHLARTGQAGMLLIRKCERQKQNWRVEFVAGFRALAAARADLSTLRQAAEFIGCGMPQVPEMISKMQEERRVAARDAKKLSERLAELEAAALLGSKAQTSRDGARRIVSHVTDDASAAYLSMLASKLVANEGVQAILASRAANAVVCAQSQGIEGDMGALLREILAPIGGKGGGSKSFAQGTVPNEAAIESVVSAARARLLS
ncbi:MAG TPA: alanyl-tRNA editing protein [Candidatus Acidoferrales bacterium]|nr:alanyl-tRNA editing protein [Candidatus Acidoferrales bacterium]